MKDPFQSAFAHAIVYPLLKPSLNLGDTLKLQAYLSFNVAYEISEQVVMNRMQGHLSFNLVKFSFHSAN